MKYRTERNDLVRRWRVVRHRIRSIISRHGTDGGGEAETLAHLRVRAARFQTEYVRLTRLVGLQNAKAKAQHR